MVARAGEAIVFPQDVSQGYRTRATIKAINAAPNRSSPPSPLRIARPPACLPDLG